MSKTKIEWTEATWNPVVGCSHCSPGCDNCYAERAAASPRLQQRDRYRQVITGKKWNGKTVLHEKTLLLPLHWKTPRMIFANSMGDMFHPSVQWGWIEKVIGVIEQCPQHTFQILTKHPETMLEYFNSLGKAFELSCCPNLWLGVTAENQKWLDIRWEYLKQLPAAVKFISHEPSLGKIILPEDFLALGKRGWFICGGESGPKARPMHPDWVRGPRDQCKAAGLPFFFKQWGEWGFAEVMANDPRKRVSLIGTSEPLNRSTICKRFPEHENATLPLVWWAKVGKKKAGCLLDGVEHKEYPEVKL